MPMTASLRLDMRVQEEREEEGLLTQKPLLLAICPVPFVPVLPFVRQRVQVLLAGDQDAEADKEEDDQAEDQD